MTTATSRFPSPYELASPAGSEGWRDIYPHYLLFNDKLKAEDAGRIFWFCVQQHWPYPFKPFDVITVEFAVKCLSQYNTRHLLLSARQRARFENPNGYLYLSPVPVAPEKIPERVPLFLERAGHYFQNWNALLDNWNKKIRGVIAEMEAMTLRSCRRPWRSIGSSGRGLDNTQELLVNYDKAIQLCYAAWQYQLRF